MCTYCVVVAVTVACGKIFQKFINVYASTPFVLSFAASLLPPATKLGQGNVFTGICDSVNRWSVLSQHALQVVSQHAAGLQGGAWLHLLVGGSVPGGVPSVMAFCCGHLLIEGGLLVWSSGGGGRRPLHHKATTPQGHNRGLVETPPQMATAADGTHPTGMHSCLEDFFRKTPRMKIFHP